MRPFVTKTLYKTLPWVVPILLLFIWQLTSKVGILSAKTLAAPSDVLLAAVELTQSGELFDHVWVSLGRALIGFCDWRRYRVHFRTRERIIPYIRTVNWIHPYRCYGTFRIWRSFHSSFFGSESGKRQKYSSLHQGYSSQSTLIRTTALNLSTQG